MPLCNQFFVVVVARMMQRVWSCRSLGRHQTIRMNSLGCLASKFKSPWRSTPLPLKFISLPHSFHRFTVYSFTHLHTLWSHAKCIYGEFFSGFFLSVFENWSSFRASSLDAFTFVIIICAILWNRSFPFSRIFTLEISVRWRHSVGWISGKLGDCDLDVAFALCFVSILNNENFMIQSLTMAATTTTIDNSIDVNKVG